jgi:hypothetical protein
MLVNCIALVTSQAKPFRYVLTDRRQFDILQSGPWPTEGAPRPTLILWIVNLEIKNGDRQR